MPLLFKEISISRSFTNVLESYRCDLTLCKTTEKNLVNADSSSVPKYNL